MSGAGQPTGFFDPLPSVSSEKLKRYDKELRKSFKRGPKHLEKLLSQRLATDGRESVMAHAVKEQKQGTFGTRA